MTEKRFTIEIDDENIAHILDNGTDIGQYNLCKLLNNLFNENEQLKKDIEYYKIERLALFEYLDKKDDLKLELKVEK